MFLEQIERLYQRQLGVKALAFEKALLLGFPSRKVEAYRKVPTNKLANFPLKMKGEQLLDLTGMPKQVIALTFEEAKKTYSLLLENRLKERVLKEKDFFAALTNALSEKGTFIYIPQGVCIEEPIKISYKYSGEFSHFASQIQIFVGKKASVKFQFLPDFANFRSGVINQGIDLYLDHESSLEIVDEAVIPKTAFYTNSLRSSLKKESKLQVWTITKGSQFFRQDFKAELLEENAEVFFNGASFLEEKNVSHTQVLIEHRAPNTRSHQHFKAVMKDEGSSTFEGKIFVTPDAQKTEAYQLNNNLLLGEKSSCFSKPNLEIFADDVKASHGATVSNLSEEELFYFQTRGISKEIAGNYLASGFLDEILKEIPKWHLIQNF